jgi:LDH2 family malate/lactate/ureidoglycolate dehydrogenase
MTTRTTERVRLSVAEARALAAEIAAIKATPRRDGVDEIRIPGAPASRGRARRMREGLEIDRRIHDAVSGLVEGRRA